MSNFTYTINGFDETTRVLSFAIEGEGERHLQLAEPLPTSIEQIEDFIRPWALHAEIVEAQNKVHDFSFIGPFVGEARETERFRRTPLVAEPTVPAEEPNPEGMVAEETAFVEAILRQHGLIQ